MALSFKSFHSSSFNYAFNLCKEEIFSPYFPNAPFHQVDFQNRLNQNKTFLIRHTNRTVGLISYRPIRNKLFLDLLVIDKNWQHQGIGKHAIQFLFKEGEQMGKSSIFLYVAPTNIKARKAYEKYGFLATSTYKGNIVMEKKI